MLHHTTEAQWEKPSVGWTKEEKVAAIVEYYDGGNIYWGGGPSDYIIENGRSIGPFWGTTILMMMT